MTLTSIAPDDFSVVVGGPLYQLFVRARILRPPLQLLARRVAVTLLVTWFPLLVLSIAGARGRHEPRVPFLHDVEVHARFLASLPLLLLAEVIVHERMRPVLQEFVARGIIRAESRSKFDQIIANSKRLRDSAWAELVIIVLALTAGQALWRSNVALHTATWYARPRGVRNLPSHRQASTSRL